MDESLMNESRLIVTSVMVRKDGWKGKKEGRMGGVMLLRMEIEVLGETVTFTFPVRLTPVFVKSLLPSEQAFHSFPLPVLMLSYDKRLVIYITQRSDYLSRRP